MVWCLADAATETVGVLPDFVDVRDESGLRFLGFEFLQSRSYLLQIVTEGCSPNHSHRVFKVGISRKHPFHIDYKRRLGNRGELRNSRDDRAEDALTASLFQTTNPELNECFGNESGLRLAECQTGFVGELVPCGTEQR